jgi:mercuric ion transport protein
MSGRTLIITGAVGTVVAAICCATPILVIGLATIDFAGVVGWLDWVLIPVLVACVAVIGYGLYCRKCEVDAYCTAPPL